MSDPVVNSYGNTFIYYTCDRDPGINEPLVYNNYSGLVLEWLNTSNGNFFICVDTTSGSMSWKKVTYQNDLPWSISNGGTGSNTASGARSSLGINTNSNRTYSPITLAFNTNRIPSLSNDTFVICNINIILSLLQSSEINVQVDSGSGFVTIASASNSSVAINSSSSLSFIVPVGSIYKILSSGTGTNSITGIMELSM